MPRRKRMAAGKDLAARVGVGRALAARAALQSGDDDAAVNESLGAEQTGLARTRVALRATDEVEGYGDAARRVEASELAEVVAYPHASGIAAALHRLASGVPVCREQHGGGAPDGQKPLRVAAPHVEGREPDGALVVEDGLDEVAFERRGRLRLQRGRRRRKRRRRRLRRG